jgi:hypothetical protein
MRGGGSRYKLQGPEYISHVLSFSWSTLAGGAQKIISPGPYTLSAALLDAASNIRFMKISVHRGRKQPIA